MRVLRAVTAAVIVILSVSAAAAESIRLVGGSTSIVTVINPVKDAFEKATGITIYATPLGSKVALQQLDAGDAEVATAAHTFDELMGVIKKEKVSLRNQADSLRWVQLAPPTGYRVIVNPANPVSTLSKEQLAGIFSGRFTNWKDVGGKDSPIIGVVSSLSPGTNETFSKTFLEGKKITIETLDATSATDLRYFVATNPEAVGFVASGIVDSSVKAVETQEMKSKPIILLTVGEPSAKVKKLINFIAAEGAKYIK